jgi:anthranilate synthase component 1
MPEGIVKSTVHVQPDPRTYADLASRWPLVPVWTELLSDVSTPVGLFPSLAGPGPGVVLESVERSERWGRYSFVAGDPAAVVTVDASGARLKSVSRELGLDPTGLPAGALPALRSVAAALRAPRLPGLPPLTGGLVGYLAYEAAELLDGSPHPHGGGPPVAPMCFLVIDRAVIFDHWRQRLLLVVHGRGPDGYRSSVAALEELVDKVAGATPPPQLAVAGSEAVGQPESNIDDDRFRAGVERTKAQILAGEIFQAVLSRRLSVQTPAGALAIYRRLRATNPAPYMFLVRTPEVELAGSSPEPLVRVEGSRVLTRPIAGTRPRGQDSDEDRCLEQELLADPKERAEHAMLLDLARNDLGRVCRPGSVEVTELMTVVRFSRVMHIVSTVEGDLAEGQSAFDALAAAFPAGTVTGAPKRRAMEIIAGEERTARGPYAGAAGYLSFAGDLDFAITIRTAVVRGETVHVHAGAGIVADSDPDRELAETGAKAAGVLAAITGGPA